MPELIARCGMRWWNATSVPVVGSVVRNAVIPHNFGDFGGIFDRLYEQKQAKPEGTLGVLLTSHVHCAKDHHDRLALIISKLFAHPRMH